MPKKHNLYALKRGTWHTNEGDVHEGFALSDDGRVLAKAEGKSIDALKTELGVKGTKNHDVYDRTFPGGWRIMLATSAHPGVKAILRKMRARKQELPHLDGNEQA